MNSGPPSREPEPPPLDVKRILSMLDTHGVEYLLSGGLGATLYGAERVSRTSICCPGPTARTSRSSPARSDALSLGATEVTTWRTEAGDLDVLATIRGERGERRQYPGLIDRASETGVTGVAIRVASLQDIVESKRFAGRDKDREALPEREHLLEQDD